MHVTYGDHTQHAEALTRGLKKMPPGFLAKLCWWCDGTTMRNYENCTVCGEGRPYGAALGLLTAWDKPAPESVVNQVLAAAGASI